MNYNFFKKYLINFIFKIVAEFYENRLPLLCRACCQQDVRCLTTVSGQNQTIGSVRQGYVEIKSTLFSKRKRK